ncbi:thiolase-like protein [Aspergillus avenaceus]|uniref:Thiolase-like protein n=1 Tax=Aspergillus avenaceus TaxID=36643 RepID=A0A5N6U3C7_ASPAV|nr:thiolase-like protein [Aspergillus avenaceus]
MSDLWVLSSDGRCKIFDKHADGYVRREAVYELFLKDLDHALRDRDHIRATVRATAAGSEGNSGPGIKDLSQTAFVECYGTVTAIGDVVEATAIAR